MPLWSTALLKKGKGSGQLNNNSKGNLKCLYFRGGAAAAPAEGEEGGEEAPAAAPQEGMDTD